MHTFSLVNGYQTLFKRLNSNIELGPWCNGLQCEAFPYGNARFVFEKEKASMNFIEALACLDVLRDIDDSNDIWPIIKNFSNTSVINDPWRYDA